MDKIKICHFADHLSGKADGIYSHIRSIVENTQPGKFEHYLCYQGNEFIESDLSDLKIERIILPELTSKIPVKAAYTFYNVCRRYNFDIIQTHFIKPYILAGIVNILLKKKVIHNYHGLFINNRFYTRFEQFVLKLFHSLICLSGGVNLVIVPSYTSKKILLKETKLFPGIEVYYNGGEIDKSVGPGDTLIDELRNSSSFNIVYAGRFAEEKRIDLSIRIIKNLIDAGYDVKFYLLGEGETENRLREDVEKLNLDNRVLFMGRTKNPQKYFSYFDLLLLSSDSEGFPLIIWEAMSQGLPIISSDAGGCREIIETVGCGRIFDNSNLDSAVNEIRNFIENEKHRKSAAAKGTEAVKQKFNTLNFGKRMENIYLNLMSYQ